MKVSKQELKQRISDNIKDNDDLVISLLEDIEDSMIETNEQVMDETAKRELEDLKWKYDNLKEKYKYRFLNKVEDDENKEDENGLEEKEIVDIKEI